jgi:transposase
MWSSGWVPAACSSSRPWQTAYERLTRWSADGTWARLLAPAQADADAAGELDWLVAADSTLVRVHQHGASARRVGGDAATVRGEGDDDQEGGRRRGRFTDRGQQRLVP